MILPLVSGVLAAAVAASFFFGFGIEARVAARDDSQMVVPVFLMYVVTCTIGIFFQAAIVAGATVGLILRALRDRAGFSGRIAVGLTGAAWSLATFFIVPVLVLEGRSVGASFKRSVEVFRKTWGETFVGSLTLGLEAACGWVTLVAVVGLLAWAGAAIAAFAVGAVGAIALLLLFSALQGVYVASLCQFATTGTTSGFDRQALAHAFAPKR